MSPNELATILDRLADKIEDKTAAALARPLPPEGKGRYINDVVLNPIVAAIRELADEVDRSRRISGHTSIVSESTHARSVWPSGHVIPV